MTQAKNQTVQDRKQTYLKALVAKFGEGKVVSLAQMIEVRDQLGTEAYINTVIAIRKGGEYKVARNQYVATVAADPSSIRNVTINNLASAAATNAQFKKDAEVAKSKAAAEKEANLLPKEVRTNASKLAEVVLGAAAKTASKKKAAKAIAKAPAAERSKNHAEVDTMDAFETYGEDAQDINDLVRTFSN